MPQRCPGGGLRPGRGRGADGNVAALVVAISAALMRPGGSFPYQASLMRVPSAWNIVVPVTRPQGWRRPGRFDDRGNVVTGKLAEDRVPTDDKITLEEIDAEYFSQSFRERIDFAVQAKSKRQLPARYFYEIIEESADDFLVEEQINSEKKQRYDEIEAAYNELIPAFRVLREHVKDDRALDGAIRDVMWSSFMIGLACDWDKSDAEETLKQYKSSVARNARNAKQNKTERWNSAISYALISVIPDLMFVGINMNKATKTHAYAKALKEGVEKELKNMELDEDLKDKKLSTYAIKMAVCRYIDEKKVRRLHKRKKSRTSLKEPS